MSNFFVTSDTSKYGLGFVLSHDADQWEIDWTGSHVLTPTKVNYSNIEHEVLLWKKPSGTFINLLLKEISASGRIMYLYNTFFVQKTTLVKSLAAPMLGCYPDGVQLLHSTWFWSIPFHNFHCLKVSWKFPKWICWKLIRYKSFLIKLHCCMISPTVEISLLKKYGWQRHIPNQMLSDSKSLHEYTIQARVVYCRIADLALYLQETSDGSSFKFYIIIILALSAWFFWQVFLVTGYWRFHQFVYSKMPHMSNQCPQKDKPASQVVRGYLWVFRVCAYWHCSL